MRFWRGGWVLRGRRPPSHVLHRTHVSRCCDVVRMAALHPKDGLRQSRLNGSGDARALVPEKSEVS